MYFRRLGSGLVAAAVLTECGTDREGPRADAAARQVVTEFVEQAPRSEILLLGVFHFADQGLDAYKPRFRLDIDSAERQRELEQLADDLARFHPTKIAVEAELDFQGELDSLYEAYRAGTYPLGTNEVYQIGFRLARRLGLPRVWAVDAPARSYMTGAEAGAKIAELGLSMDSLMREIENDLWTARYRRLYQREDSLKAVGTLAEHLLYINDPERIRVGHGAYLVGSFKLVGAPEYLGPDDATSWYNRNLRIFSNIQHLTAGRDERILLIIGAGHLPILRFLAQASPEYRLREPSEFLRPR